MSREEFTGYIDWEARKVYVDFGTGEETPVAIQYDVNELARQVIAGYWGNGADRVRRFREAGYTDQQIESIQQRVNELMGA